MSDSPAQTTVADVVAVLDRRCPSQLAESWDNTGLLLGCRAEQVSRLMTCLTLTPDVAAEAVREGVGMVVSHHPILFTGTKRLTDDKPDTAAILELVRAEVAVYSPHTSFDSAGDGINAWLGRQLGLDGMVPILPSDDSPTIGTGRIGQLPDGQSLGGLADRLATVTNQPGLHVVGDESREVGVLAIACGAAGSLLGDATAAGADVFLTGEIRFHDALTARSTGIALLIPGHYATERPAVEWLADALGDELTGVDCFASREESDPLRWRSADQVC